ncbi:hypothetical protein RA262_27985, partial [Pseudomonas syringae pv. tagetis]
MWGWLVGGVCWWVVVFGFWCVGGVGVGWVEVFGWVVVFLGAVWGVWWFVVLDFRFVFVLLVAGI